MNVITEKMEEKTNLKEINTLFIIYLIYNIPTDKTKLKVNKTTKKKVPKRKYSVDIQSSDSNLKLISTKVKLCSIIVTVDSTVHLIC